MPIHESSFFGLLFSPLFLMVVISVAITSVAVRIIDRVIPYSMQRNESLMSMLMFMVILASLVRFTF